MNLVPFALFSEKIPATFLAPEKKKPAVFKNIFSLFIDYLAVSSFSALTTSMMSLFFNSYLGTFSSKFYMTFPSLMGFVVFPLMLFTYYSICLYTCDGMTLGTQVTKQRIAFSTPLKTAALLTLAIISFGAAYFLVKDFFESRDYRYQEMMTIKDQKVDLHAFIHEEVHEDQPEYSIAA